MDKVSLHCHVSGRVQGVFFRASTREQARELGLDGWVRNLPDGRVEVLACGPADAIDRLHAWLAEGPPLARVEALDCRRGAGCPEALTGFHIIH
ncbi:MAG: acylphosphatase [Gammaproteobacteria bacterium]|nr:MAG: acylphosphatase [Gammaproteobacteria bacterium]